MDQDKNHRERIAQAARADAAKPGDVNHHCRYPFGTTEGRAYRAAFAQERARMERVEREQLQPGFEELHRELEATPTDFAETESPFCGCTHALSVAELDFNKCVNCGKELLT